MTEGRHRAADAARAALEPVGLTPERPTEPFRSAISHWHWTDRCPVCLAFVLPMPTAAQARHEADRHCAPEPRRGGKLTTVVLRNRATKRVVTVHDPRGLVL